MGGVFSVSMTTRSKTDKDIEGVDYFFVDRVEFQQRLEAGDLLEWAVVFGHSYGTPKRPVLSALAAGRLVILEVDVEGAIQVKTHLPDAFAIFVKPPDEQVLLARLRHRKREGEQLIQRRLATARHEIERAASCGIYDLFIVNKELCAAVRASVDMIRQKLARRMGD